MRRDWTTTKGYTFDYMFAAAYSTNENPAKLNSDQPRSRAAASRRRWGGRGWLNWDMSGPRA